MAIAGDEPAPEPEDGDVMEELDEEAEPASDEASAKAKKS